MREAKRSFPWREVDKSVTAPRRKHSKVMTSGGREGREVRRAGLANGSGMGLFAGPRGIPAGGFIALHRGRWEWTGDSDRTVSTVARAPTPSHLTTGEW